MSNLGKKRHRMLRLRKQLWHLRHGGIAQLKTFLVRERVFGANHGFARGTVSNSKVLWGDKATAEIPAVRKNTKNGCEYRLEYEDLAPLPLPKTYPNLHVAVILDDFSLQAWGHEFEVIVLSPDKWEEQLTENPVDFLLVESAWAGNNGVWKYHLTGDTAPRPPVLELLTWCRKRSIPSVFWNKEDPPHFEDFLDTARLFDYVFTSDSNMVSRYQEELGHNRIYPLSFAAAPSVHNPVKASKYSGIRGVAFAGTYFAHKFPERREQIDMLLTGALSAARKSEDLFEIYSRFWGKDARYQFPTPFDKAIVGSLPYSQMLRAYKAHKVFLNVNSVVNSPSMCARRIFEILASGTPVVTAPSEAIRHFFNERQLLVAENSQDAELKIRSLLNSPMLRQRTVHLAQRTIWAQHTYAHRAEQIVNALGITSTTHSRSLLSKPLVSILVSTIRPEQIEHIFETAGKQKNVCTQLVLLTHGFKLSAQEVERLSDKYLVDNLVLLNSERSRSLGSCLNLMVSAASGQVFAKMDDDDLYGEYYLLDMINSLKYSGADLVGKNAHYVYLKQKDMTVLRRPDHEHRFTDFVAGPTLTGWAETFKRHPFEDKTTGEDTAFVRSIVEAGGRVYATDRYNFVQLRSSSQIHTWKVDEELLLANGTALYTGLHKPDMML